MAASQRCQRCGMELAEATFRRLCPRCLLWEGLAEGQGPELKNGPRSFGEGIAFGDYELLEEIGRGGMGVVYKARQKSLDRIVALKTLLFEPRASRESVERFRAEAIAAAGLQHPNIVAIHEIGVHEGQHYFVMDYVAGRNLAQASAEFGVRNAEFHRCAQWIKTIAEAVHYAHEHGILHRDLKPSNVLIDADDQPHITDFGLAKRIADSQLSTLNAQLTLTGQVLGSPSYIPPEQAAGSQGAVSRQSDVYALGAMLYHLLTGRPPFQGKTITETLQQVLNTEPVAPHWLNTGIPRDLETICLKCLEKEIPRRYRTAREVAEELDRFLANKPILARPVGAAGKAWKWCRRRPALAVTGGALVLAVALGLAGVLWQWHRARHIAMLERQQRERAEAGEYVANIGLVQNLIAEKDLDRARETLLSRLPERYRGWEWGWLQRRCNQDLMALDTSPFAIFDPNTRMLATADQPAETVRLWDLASGQVLRNFPEKTASLWQAVFSPDGRHLATAAPIDPIAVIWDVATGQPLHKLTHPHVVPHVAYSRDGKRLATACFDGKARIWDAERGVLLDESPDYGDEVFCAEFSPDGRQLAYCGGKYVWSKSQNSSVWIWDPKSRQIRSLEGHTRAVLQVAWHPRTNLLASAGWDGQVLLWDTRSWRQVRRSVETSGVCVFTVAFSPDGHSLGVAGMEAPKLNACALVLEVPTLRRLYEIPGSTGFMFTLAFSADGKYLATTGGGERARIWPASPVPAYLSLEGHDQPVWSTAFSGNGKWIATGSLDQTVKLWDVASGALLQNLVVAFPAISLRFSPDSSRLVTVGPDNTALVWNVETNRSRKTSATEPTRTLSAGRGSQPAGEIPLSVPTATQPVQTLRGHAGAVMAVDWSPNGWWIATASKDRTAKIWEAATGRLQATLSGHRHWVWAVALAPNDTLLATGSEDKTLRLWDIGSARCLRVLTNHTAAVIALAFSPDGSLLASGGMDAKLRLWDVRSSRELYAIASPGGVASIAFGPDGRRVATAASSLEPPSIFGRDTRVRLWDVVSGQELLGFVAHSHTVCSVAFSPDGRWLATGSVDNTARLWQAFPWRLSDYAGLPEQSLGARVEAYKRAFWRTSLDAREAAALAPPDAVLARRTVKDPFGDFNLPLTGSKTRPLRPIPPRPSAAGAGQLDLGPHYNVALKESWQPVDFIGFADLSLSTLSPGMHTFCGVPFDVRGLVQLRLNDPEWELFPEKVSIAAGGTFSRLHVLHGIRGSDRGTATLAAVVLRYAGGAEQVLPVVRGVHLRGPRDPNVEETAKECPQGELAWVGPEPTSSTDPAQLQLRLYKTTFANPRPAERVESIEYRSTISQSAPFLVALTVE